MGFRRGEPRHQVIRKNEMTPATDIETEIAYKPLQPWAITSLIFGVCALAAFVPLPLVQLFAWPACAMAVGSGVFALRRIQSESEYWGGQRVAQLGILLGVLLGVGSLANMGVSRMLVHKDGMETVEQFAGHLRAGRLDRAFWMTLPPAYVREIIAGSGRASLPEGQYSDFLNRGARYFADTDHPTTMALVSVVNEGTLRGTDFLIARYRVVHDGVTQFLVVNASTTRDPVSRAKEWYVREHLAGENPAIEMPTTGEGGGGGGHGHSH